MCGIAGYIRRDDSPIERDPIERMVTALKHRGPDAQTVHIDGQVGLGHARLSIIDLAGGHQPLFNEDRSIAVVCNGEIYNYRELRKNLISAGHLFRTGSDCEVLTHLWEESGPKMLDQLRGMFAFILYDRKQGIVFGARDRFGQKPLFYYEGADHVAFASEIKGLLVLPEVLRELDPLGLDQFLFHQFIPQPRTLFAGVKKLAAGSCFEIKLLPTGKKSSFVETPNQSINQATYETQNGLFEKHQPQPLSSRASFVVRSYWSPSFAPDETLSTPDHLARVEAGLIDAIESHMIADVPVGVFLSGGIDSSLITAMAVKFNPEPLNTFSISFPGSEHDEAPFARSVAASLGTNHHEFPFEPADMRQVLTSAATLFDQPLADMAVLPLMALSQAASEYVKVVLTGDGGDELFAGYRKYKRMTSIPGRFQWLSRISSQLFPMHQLAACCPDPIGLRKFQTRLAMVIAPQCRTEYQRQSWEGWERFSLYQTEFAQKAINRFEALLPSDDSDEQRLSPLNQALKRDQGTVLADRLLLKGDYATMAYGLESRAPLLDHKLAAIAGALPLHLKATPDKTKVALREIARRYLPEEIINRRKKGFSMPIDRWFRTDLKSWVRSCLIDDSVSLPRYFQRTAIERLLSEHAAGKNHSARIHTLLTFELWSRAYATP
jgi:asparagine synthase (glutamine-hydrolysing)